MPNIIHSENMMISMDEGTARHFYKISLAVGGVLVVLGLASLVVPQITSLVIEVMLGWLLLFAGLASAYLVYASPPHRPLIAWLKPVLLIVTGGLMLFQPLAGIAAMALILTVYLLIDSAAGMALSYDHYPHKGWGWLALNGFMSLLLAALVMAGWPSQSALIIGLLVGLSLFFDGLAMIMLGILAWNALKDQKDDGKQ